MAAPGDYVRLNQVRTPQGSTARYRYAILGEREMCGNETGWSAALVNAGDREGRSSCVSVWLKSRSFRRA